MSENDEGARAAAVFTLAMHRERFPELNTAEGTARHALAAAIQRMDEADALLAAAEPGEGMEHLAMSLRAQSDVERRTLEYTQALANLLRGEEPE